MLDSLNDYLHDVYEETGYNHCTQWPPDQPKSVVSNTLLIHYKDKRTQRALLDMSKHQRDASSVDEITSSHPSRITKSIASIFESPHQKFTLIEGAPGFGKTVLMQEIAYRWACGEVLQGKRLFLVFVRNPKLHDVDSINREFMSYFSHNYLTKSEVDVAVDELRKSRGQNIVFVIDGFDECPADCRLKQFIENLAKHEIFPKSMVVITSRPHASVFLRDFADQRIEILGFSKKEREEYISESLEFPEKINDLVKYLKLHPIICSVMHVPFHLAVLLYLFKKDSLPETLTELNEQFVIHTIHWHLKKHPKLSFENKFEKIKDLPKPILKVVTDLSKLAMYGLLDWERVVFTYEEVKAVCTEIDEAPNGFGLLQAVQHHVVRGTGNTYSFNFLHLTMQEFLAAYHLSTLPSKEQTAIAFSDDLLSYYYVWTMYVGIIGVESNIFIEYRDFIVKAFNNLFSKQSCYTPYSKVLFLLQCYLDAKKIEEVPEILSSLFNDGNIKIEGDIQPHNLVSLINFMMNSDIPFRSLTLSDCNITDEGISILQGFFTEFRDKVATIQRVSLNKNYISSLWGAHSDQSMIQDEGLLLIPCLDLSATLFKDDGIIKLFATLQCNTTLLQLDISHNGISITGAMAIGECLKHNITLKKLDLSHNNLLDNGVKTICESLKTNHALKVLNIACNSITNIGAIVISDAIKLNTTLSHLVISKNFIDKEGIMAILIACTNTRVLHTLELECIFNMVTQSDFLSITDYIRKGNTIKIINASWYWFSCDGYSHRLINTSVYYKDGHGHDINFCKQGEHCSWFNNIDYETKTKIIFSCIKDSSVEQLYLRKWFKNLNLLDITAEAIQVNKKLKKICIKKYDIGSDEVLALSKCFTVNCLEEFDISESDVAIQAMEEIIQSVQQSTALQRLNISKVMISVSVMEFVGICLKNNNTLRALIMVETKMNDEGAKKLAEGIQLNTALRTLDISRNELSNIGIKVISDSLRKNDVLQELNISYNEYVSAEGVNCFVEFIKTNTTLLKLNMMQYCDGIISAITDCLTTNDKLQHMHICCAPLFLEWGGNECITLLAAIESNRSLQSVSISGMKISDDEAIAISNCLQSNNLIQEIKLCHCSLINTQEKYRIQCMRRGIRSNVLNTLRYIEFEHLKLIMILGILINRFIDQTQHKRIGRIIDAINVNNTLKALTFTHCMLRDGGAEAISDCITHNASIKELDLSWNLITSKGGMRLFNAIQVNQVLEKLDVSHNKICNELHDDEIEAMSNCIKNNTTLQEFCISTDEINDQASHSLADALKVNTSLYAIKFDQYGSENAFSFNRSILSAMYENKTIMSIMLPWTNTYNEFCVVQSEVESINMERRSQAIEILNVTFALSYNIEYLSDI